MEDGSLTYLWLDRWEHWPPSPRRPGVSMSAAPLMLTMSGITWWGSGAHFAHVRPPWGPTHNWEQCLVTTPGSADPGTHETSHRARALSCVLPSGHQCRGGDTVWTMSPGLQTIKCIELWECNALGIIIQCIMPAEEKPFAEFSPW